MRRKEGPGEQLERAASRLPPRQSRSRARGGLEFDAEKIGALGDGRIAKPDRVGAQDVVVGSDTQGTDELQAGRVPGCDAVVATASLGMMTRGDQNFDAGMKAGDTPNSAGALKVVDQAGDSALGLQPHEDPHFVSRWTEAVRLQMGVDELQKFEFAWRQRNSHDQ